MVNFDDSWKTVENFNHAKNFHHSFSCNALVDGRMMVYGGLPFDNDYKKISEVKDCGVKEIGHLPHDFYMGLCAKVSMVGSHEAAILCGNQHDPSGQNDKKRCFSIDHQGASMDSRMHYVHDRGAMGSIGHTAILVGGYDGPVVEMSEFGIWRTVEDYPFGDSIYYQNIVTVGHEIIMAGGIGDRGPTKTVSKAALSGRGLKWSNVGNLLYARYGHAMGMRKAQTGIEVYILGGHPYSADHDFGDRVEKWTFKSQEQPSKEMTDIEVFPWDPTSPFIVPFDFCF